MPEREVIRLAKALGRAIDQFNDRAPSGQRIKMNAVLSRILDNDPDRPRTKRARRNRPTQDPGVFTLRHYAQRTGTTVAELIGEAPRSITPADRDHAKEMIGWLSEVFALEGSEMPSPVTTPQTVEEKLRTASTLMGAGTVVRIPERTLPRWTPEFPIEPNEFNDAGATDYPLDLHGREPEELDEAGVPDIGSMPLLNSKEVRTSKVKVVNVRDDSVAPFNAGWKLGIDVTQQNPALIEDGEVAVAYRKDQGSFVGRLYHEPDRTILLTDRGDEINLADQWMFIGPVTQAWITKIAKQPRTRKKKGGIS